MVCQGLVFCLLENLVFSAISFGGLAVSLFFYTGSTRVRIPVKPKLKKSLNFSQKLVVHAARARDRLIRGLALCQLRCAGLFISKWVGGFTRSRLSLIRVPHLNKNSRPSPGRKFRSAQRSGEKCQNHSNHIYQDWITVARPTYEKRLRLRLCSDGRGRAH